MEASLASNDRNSSEIFAKGENDFGSIGWRVIKIEKDFTRYIAILSLRGNVYQLLASDSNET